MKIFQGMAEEWVFERNIKARDSWVTAMQLHDVQRFQA